MAWNSDYDPYAEEDYPEVEEVDPQLDPSDGGEHEDESESASTSSSEPKSEPESESEGVTSGSPTPEPVASSLDDAIKAASVAQLQSLLIFICQKHEPAKKIASSRLLAPLESGTGQKRKAFEKCKNCGEEYNVLDNMKGFCEYHSGEKEVDDDGDFWADHDENCHGRIYDLADDPSYEDGFVWTCCDKIGSGSPCVRSRHKPDPHAKRLRN